MVNLRRLIKKIMRHFRNSQGFSLIEIGVVILVIALIATGVLVGKDVLAKAQMQAFMAEMTLIGKAAKNFEEKYNCIAGDCAFATELFGKNTTLCNAHSGTAATPGTCNGNGDGLLNSTDEKTYFWQQLILSELLPEYTYPTSSAGWPKETLYSADEMTINKSSSLVYDQKYYIEFLVSNVPQLKLIELDKAYDDGVANAGKIKVNVGNDVYPDDPAACSDGAATYSPASIGNITADGCYIYILIE